MRVELTFDNSDGRFSVEAPAVTFSRTAGVKKDEYFVNGRTVKRNDIWSLLESAGFSRSNPYYIVAQGKVASLASMSDSERLALLKDVAGTHVYDERRSESLGILEEATAKREQIGLMLGDIDDRLAVLESEREELQKFTQLDRRRRALEFTLFQSEAEKAEAELEASSHGRPEIVRNAHELQDRLLEISRAVTLLEKERNAAVEVLRAMEVGKSEGTWKMASWCIGLKDREVK